nr:uncharacterized protein LOC109178314 isoform X1 [Ipomoea batatas]
MNHAIQMDHSNSQLALPVKRRRGRPRKDRSLNHAGSTQVPPVGERVKENPAPRVEKNSDAVNDMVGQAVTGIIEAAFDAGFLLSVRIGDGKTRLRGIVFKPGHYVPITAENDIAPHVQMIQRNEINLPTENQMRSRKRYRHRTERNGSPSARRASKGNNLSIMLAPSVPPVGARGTVVPVVLQPVSLTNGLPRTTETAMDASQAYMEALRDKGVQMVTPLAMLPPEGSTAMMVAHEASSSQRQLSHEEPSEGVQNQKGSPSDRGRRVEHGEETSHVAPSNVVMPSASGDVDRNQGYPQPPENLHVRQETDMNKPPSTKPLEALHPNLLNDPKSLPNKFMHYGTGRMTELLQALQEKLVENQVHESTEIKFSGSNNKDEATKQ